MEKISAFIIAKNEEANIAIALKSLVSFCDEIIVVDTGSTDKTKEIALQFTDKIFDFKWIDDFSAGRNFAVEKCAGDWIVWLDADDEIPLQSQNQLKEAINSASKETLGLLVSYRYSKDKLQLLPRAFRNNKGLKFKMPVHEYLEVPADKLKLHPEILILHHKKTQENKETIQRNLHILKKAAKKEPENFHVKFFLGRDLLNAGEYKEAVEIFRELLEDKSIKDNSFKYNIALHMGHAYAKKGNYNDAIIAYQKAEPLGPKFAEPLIFQADILLYNLKKIDAAKNLYEKSLKIPKPKTTFPVNQYFYHDYPKEQIYKIGQLNKPIALMCGYYGQLNIGDELMLHVLIQKFQPKYRIIAASYNPRVTQGVHKIESVPHKHPYFDQALKQSKLVIIGGGTLFHDQGLKENKNVEYYCGIIENAGRLDKKVWILGVGVDDIKLESNRKLILETFPKCEKISVRDEKSKQNLISCGINKKDIVVEKELVFDLKIKSGPGQDKFSQAEATPIVKKPRIGINLCPPPVDNPEKLMKQVTDKLIPFMKKHRNDFEFIFIPGHQKDIQFLALFKEKLGYAPACFKPDFKHYISGYLSLVNACDYIIASRYHMLVLGIILKKPTVALSYAEKTDSLIREYNLPVDPEEIP